MTPLTKQLEDKKKGCGKILNFNEKNENICNEDTIYCPICKAEIAILEQAIAEMQKIQSQQQNHEMTEKECGANTTVEVDKITDTPQEERYGSSVVSNLLQKQRQEILDKIDLYLMVTKGNYECQKALEELKQQLNQPKTEE